MAVKIGIVYLGDGLFRKYMYSKYYNSLISSGAQVKLLPWIKSEDEASLQLKDCDGLLIPGGKDISPELYGEEILDCCGKLCPERDICEPLYFKAAREAGLPVLGICRGFQIINVILGGTLWQDFRLRPEKTLNHSSFLKRARYLHEVKVEEGSILSRATSALQGVNSIHHQGIKTLSPALNPTAYSTDGICEAYEGREGAFLLAVQWHPEHLYKRDECARKIFKLFIEAAEK